MYKLFLRYISHLSPLLLSFSFVIQSHCCSAKLHEIQELHVIYIFFLSLFQEKPFRETKNAYIKIFCQNVPFIFFLEKKSDALFFFKSRYSVKKKRVPEKKLTLRKVNHTQTFFVNFSFFFSFFGSLALTKPFPLFL